jgi:hypothetical protein
MRQGLRPALTGEKRSAWIKKPLALIVLALMLGSVLAATGLAPSAMGNAHRKPDLVVTQATKFGPAYAFHNHEVTLSSKDVTKNLKKPRHDATAGRSRTKMFLVPLHSGQPNPARVGLGSRAVPKLAPDHSDRGAASEGFDSSILAFGAYKAKVCADARHQVKERNEDNNCTRAGYFYVVPFGWQGSLDTDGVKGVGVAAGAAKAEKFHSSDGSLQFGRYLGGGIFLYDFYGTVEWKDSGVNSGGCTVSGQGKKTYGFTPGLRLDYLGGTYHGKVLAGGSFYTISITGGFPCGSTAPGPATKEVLNIGDPMPLLFDQEQLKGSFSTGEAEGATWRWDF